MTRSAGDERLCLIAGGGPVGLFLACCLVHLGIRCMLLEPRRERSTESRSIGVHPLSLEMLERLGLAAAFLDNGCKITQGRAYLDRRYVGSIQLAHCRPPYRFVLSLPQPVTERLLEQHLEAASPGLVRRGARVIGYREHDGGIRVRASCKDGIHDIEASFLVACDGMRSALRRMAGIRFAGGPSGDAYLMGDFSTASQAGSHSASIYLHRDGVVECFPLPGGVRRWVAKTDATAQGDLFRCLLETVSRRTGRLPDGLPLGHVSRFKAYYYTAESMVRGRLILAGDAAHVVSPIGGQGMNLGWLQAWRLAQAFTENRGSVAVALRRYDTVGRRLTRKVARRAMLNTVLGRRRRHVALRNTAVRLLVGSPLRRVAARAFTMDGLDRWPL